jgi:hypothetical protein
MTAADLGGTPRGVTPASAQQSRGAVTAYPGSATLSLWRKPPSGIDLTVQVPRPDVTENELEAAVTRIHRALGQAGVISHVGGTMNWLANSRTRKVHISVVTREGRTTIQAHEKLAPLAAAVYGVGVWGVGVFCLGWTSFIVGINTLHSTPLALGLFGTMVAASWGGTRAIYTHLVARRQRQLGSLIEDIGQGLVARTLQPDLVDRPDRQDQQPGGHAREKSEGG